jgi:hypothetical protein
VTGRRIAGTAPAADRNDQRRSGERADRQQEQGEENTT